MKRGVWVVQRAFSPKIRKRVHEPIPGEKDLKAAQKFAKIVDAKLGDFLKSASLFGSCATAQDGKTSDIDILFVVDDIQHSMTPEVTTHYRSIIEVAARKISPRFHVNTLKLSSFWEYCREGDPVVISMLRDGYVLIDKGFFGATQLLLEQGRIRPSREAVWTYYSRSASTLRSARKHILTACVDLYWAAVDAAHSALMSVGEVPTTPDHIPDLLQRVLVKKGLLDKQYPRIMRELYNLQKGIQHREIKEINGEQYDAYWAETLRFVDALRHVVETHPPR